MIPSLKIKKEKSFFKNMNQPESSKKIKNQKNAHFSQSHTPDRFQSPRVIRLWMHFIKSSRSSVNNQIAIMKCMRRIKNGKNKKLIILKNFSSRKKKKNSNHALLLPPSSLFISIGMTRVSSICRILVLNRFSCSCKSKRTWKWTKNKRSTSALKCQVLGKYGPESQQEEELQVA